MTDQPVMMTEEEIAALERLAESATGGPWNYCGAKRNGAPCECGMVFGDKGSVYVHYPPDVNVVDPVRNKMGAIADSLFIAASRTAVPRLIEAYRHLQAELAVKDDVISSYGNQIRKLRAEAQRASTVHGEPKAWLLYCPKGHEFDALVLPDEESANDERANFTDELPEGEEWEPAIPLYAINPIEVERLQADLAAARAEIEELKKV